MTVMKGIFSSIVVLVAFLSALLVVIAFSNDIQKNYDIVTVNAVNDRVFYKFAAVEHSIIRTIENDLRGRFNVTIMEGNSNFVTFNTSLPSAMGNLSSDLSNLEKFARTRLNESNMAVDVNLTSVRRCLQFTVLPYNITYSVMNSSLTDCGFGNGERNLRITPSGNGAGSLNSYDMTLLANNYAINTSSASWTTAGQCTGGTFNWTIRVVGNNTVYGPVTNMINPNGTCQFTIRQSGTQNQIINVTNAATKVLTVRGGSAFDISLITTLVLADTQEKLQVALAPQAIKVKESLFQVERNYTAVIQ